MKGLMTFTIVVFLVFIYSCQDKAIEIVKGKSVSFSSNSSKCLLHGLSTAVMADTGFKYSFIDSLIIDFDTQGNCCPDSNRFAVSYQITNDTIIISVADTAGDYCRCLCPYLIHTEFGNLPNDHYVVRCEMSNWYSSYNPIHLVDVYRKKF